MQEQGQSNLALNLTVERKALSLGEPVNLRFELKNNGSDDLTILDAFGTGTGFLTVHISEDGKNYTQHEAGWGSIDLINAKTHVKRGESIVAKATVLWQRKGTDSQFTFTEPGVYFLKAKYNVTIDGKNHNIILESDPIEITVTEPDGADLTIWRKIKSNGNIAYLLERNDMKIPSYNVKERAKFQKLVESIILEYPNSSFATSLNLSFRRFLENEELTRAAKEQRTTNQ